MSGVSEYGVLYEDEFVSSLRRYAGKREQIHKRVERIIDDPYANTEML
jgi:hypothetical protein